MKSICSTKLNPLNFLLALKNLQSFYFYTNYVLEYQLNKKRTSVRDNTIILLKIEIPCDKYLFMK